MSKAISDLKLMISGMEPVLNEGVYVYTSVTHEFDKCSVIAIATIRENEGTTLIIPESQALKNGFTILFRCAWITLNVHSDLNAYGLTAAIAKALSEHEISCNVVAGAFHDHIFVPIDLSKKSLEVLQQLQRSYED